SSDSGSEPRRLTAGERSFAQSYRAPLWLNDETLLAQSADTLWKISVTSGAALVGAAPQDRRLIDIVAPADAQRYARRGIVVAVTDAGTKQSGFRSYD